MPFSTRQVLAAAAIPALALAQQTANETVLGVYMFHRHGDRTSKSTPPANLTDLGYQEVYTSGQYYRNRYIASGSDYKIAGVSTDIVKQSQIQVTAPSDTVLQNSAVGFLQALYPPVGTELDTETLRNGTIVTAPLDGYQLIPVNLVTGGAGGGSEDNGWLQSASGCASATISSNNYFLSQQYEDLLNSTQDFYTRLAPVVGSVFNSSQLSYKNAYTIWDFINVAAIHNSSIPSSDLLDADTLFQLRTLADSHEWGLAYNSSDDMRAMVGKTLAAEAVQFLNATITGKGKQKIGIQFGAYASFLSFFGLAELPVANPDFMAVVDYASAMTFELFTNASTTVSSTSYPSNDDIYVRFLFHNGTTSNISVPANYPLFGSGQEAIGWNDFATGMNKFAVGTTEEWCTSCGNSTGSCAAFASSSSTGSNSTTAGETLKKSGNGLSPVVNGVIGAMVTLAVVLGLEALALAVFGLRVVSKESLAARGGSASPSEASGIAAKA